MAIAENAMVFEAQLHATSDRLLIWAIYFAHEAGSGGEEDRGRIPRKRLDCKGMEESRNDGNGGKRLTVDSWRAWGMGMGIKYFACK